MTHFSRRTLKPILFGLFILTGACSTTSMKNAGNAAPQNDLHLYLLIGQSNMAGRAFYAEEDALPIPGVYLLNEKDEWEIARNPLNRYSTIRKHISMQRMGPGYEFVKELRARTPSTKIGLIVNAKGGSGIQEWKQGSYFYQEAVRRTQRAISSGELKGVLWHQGETDQYDSDYLAKLEKLVQDLRVEFNNPELPFVAGQINNIKLINDQIAELPSRVPYTEFVSSDGLIAVDEWHFDLASMKLMGQRYAEKILLLQKQSTNK